MTLRSIRPLPLLFLITLAVMISACDPRNVQNSLLITLVADGRERAITLATPLTVEELLRQERLELAALDRVNPPPYAQIADGMRVTIVRVQEQTECAEEALSYPQRSVPIEGLAPGETRLGQAGQNGVVQVCYRITTNDGIRQPPVEVSRTEIRAPQEELIYVGPTGQLDAVPVTGTLAYVSSGNAWIIRGSSDARRPLTQTGDLDSRVFRLTPDGRSLLVARAATEAQRGTAFNKLHLITDTFAAAPPLLPLTPENVLYADWMPGQPNTISYATGEPRDAAPGWEAHNDLLIMRVDPATGEAINLRDVVRRSNGGLYGWWGTEYAWSPDGSALAWVRADSIGLVDLQTGDLNPLVSFPVFNTRQPWSWRAEISWTPDAELLLTTVHGQPIGSEPAESSPAFHVAVVDADGAFNVEIVRNAGIWSTPRYAPLAAISDSTFADGAIAYLKARDLSDSVNDLAEYDLLVADRDGSNARRLFPAEARDAGLTAAAAIAWSPDGTAIAFIYQGNLWMVDAESGIAHQLTLDGAASRPVWTR